MHKFVRVTHGNMSADIDELIAPLIKTMWEADIITAESCQGYEGIASIYFDGVEHPRKFLEMVWEPEQMFDHNLPIGFPFWLKWKTWFAPQWKNGKVDYTVMIGFPYNEIEGFIQRIKSKQGK